VPGPTLGYSCRVPLSYRLPSFMRAVDDLDFVKLRPASGLYDPGPGFLDGLNSYGLPKPTRGMFDPNGFMYSVEPGPT
jgi:hypothetical protein